MMKKRSILMLVCALMTSLSIGTSVGCGGASGQSSVGGNSDLPTTSNSTASEETGTSEEQGTSEEPTTSEDSGTSEDPTTSENPGTSEEPTTPDVDALKITSPTGEVFPYIDAAKAFLQAGEGADVVDYAQSTLKNPQTAVQIKWKYDAEGARKFLIEYATKADYSDAIQVEMGAAKRSLEVYNLYKGTKYYLRITALNAKGATLHVAESEFQTTDLGPRVMNVEGAYNVRDLGGFDTCFGKKIVQGIAYRGGMLHYNATGNNGDLTEAGKKTLSEELGIKAELDFRNESEAWVTMEDGSSIPGATLTYITAGGYEDIFKNGKEPYRKIFSYLSNKDNYPLYYHCTAGADRTGSVTYILHAFLGVSELECHQDFAFTSFSIYGVRGSQSGRGDNSERYFNMVNMLKECEGDNLQQKAENYLLSIGVTAEELANIKGIFFGEIAVGNQTATVNNVAMPTTGEKPLSEQYAEVLSAWTIQKKENR